MTQADNRYHALGLQTRCDAVNRLGVSEARAAMRDCILRVHDQIEWARGFIGPDLKLVVLPEYFMTSYPLGDTIEGWAHKAAIAPDGPEYNALGKCAQELGVWLCGNAYETDRHFPDIYFQTCFLIDPSGDVILRYRRLISMFAPTPHDVWERYLDVYGIDGVFPVADTGIGRLACCASEEILFPEVCRAHALRGAEILPHPTIENVAYVISANTAGIHGAANPAASVDAMSKVIDYKGNVLASAGHGETIAAYAQIDLGALRAWRRRPGMPNYHARQRLELFADTYANASVYPPNTLLDETGEVSVPERGHFIKTQRRTIAKLADDGVI